MTCSNFGRAGNSGGAAPRSRSSCTVSGLPLGSRMAWPALPELAIQSSTCTPPVAVARLKTLVDRYPLYSGADEALYLLGQSYEGEINAVRKNPRANEVAKTRMIEELTKGAAEAYGKIIKRYPAMDRAVDAKTRLEALHQPVPRPTRAAFENSKKEEASRQQ